MKITDHARARSLSFDIFEISQTEKTLTGEETFFFSALISVTLPCFFSTLSPFSSILDDDLAASVDFGDAVDDEVDGLGEPVVVVCVDDVGLDSTASLDAALITAAPNK